MPVNAIGSQFTMSSKKRFVSALHEFDGMARRISRGFLDSSLILAAMNDMKNARIMRKAREYQK